MLGVSHGIRVGRSGCARFPVWAGYLHQGFATSYHEVSKRDLTIAVDSIPLLFITSWLWDRVITMLEENLRLICSASVGLSTALRSFKTLLKRLDRVPKEGYMIA